MFQPLFPTTCLFISRCILFFSRERFLSNIVFSRFVFSSDFPLFTIPFDSSLSFALLRVHLRRKNGEVNRREGRKKKEKKEKKKRVRDIVVEILKYQGEDRGNVELH